MSGIVGGVGSNSGLVGRNEAEYETGTFEPSFGTSASHGSNTIALSYSYGFYVKVGHMVRVNWHVRRTSNAGTFSSGNLYIRNLPFKATDHPQHTGSAWLDHGSSAGYKVGFYIGGAQTYANFSFFSTDNRATRYVSPPDTYWPNNWYMYGGFTYTSQN